MFCLDFGGFWQVQQLAFLLIPQETPKVKGWRSCTVYRRLCFWFFSEWGQCTRSAELAALCVRVGGGKEGLWFKGLLP